MSSPVGNAPDLDPLGDGERMEVAGTRKNFAKVGSGRPSSLLYTHGPGAVMDLPHFTVMPAGFDDWDPIWKRRLGESPTLHAPRLLDVVRMLLGPQVAELRPFPWQPKQRSTSREGNDLGVPSRVFPQWLRCTGCDRLMSLPALDYVNTHPYRPDQAEFRHAACPGRRGQAPVRAPQAKTRKRGPRTAVPARYLLACPRGHLDEFPYGLWVHEGADCPNGDVPALYLSDRTAGKGAMATVECRSCGAARGMNEAQGEAGRRKLPRCRGRHPHLNAFEACGVESRLMLIGASNLWFPAVQSIVVMPQSVAEEKATTVERLRALDDLTTFQDQLPVVRALANAAKIEVGHLDDDALAGLVTMALAPQESEQSRLERRDSWDPVDLLAPEWRYLQRDPKGPHDRDEKSGLTLTKRALSSALDPRILRVLAVEELRKVNAVVGFTRIDELERVSDLESRLVRLTRNGAPSWVVATEDRGEGVYLDLDEARVSAWEQQVLASPVWAAHRAAHERNLRNRFSETAKQVEADDRLRPPRYWLLHTLAHVLFREFSMHCGYGAASLSERVYAWCADDERERPAAAGLLVLTTASDSDGTLGGLVSLSEPDLLAALVERALQRARRCSSDPVCAGRTPQDPEDFLHGAACHGCAMASETSCERANRFLDRRFLVDLPGSQLGFFS